MASCVFLLLVVITLSGLGPASSQSWHWFQKKHIDNSVRAGDDAYCNSQIRNRGIRGPRLKCKQTNTFIHAPPSTIKGLCRAIDGRRTITSNNRYDLTDCRLSLKRHKQRPKICSYRASDYHEHIEIVCEGGAPVHFKGHSHSLNCSCLQE